MAFQKKTPLQAVPRTVDHSVQSDIAENASAAPSSSVQAPDSEQSEPHMIPEGHLGLDHPELGISVFETSVLLLVVGIACGVFFKGREMVHHAQASALMDRVTEVQAAWYAFNDRFGAAPGDSAPNGNGNGQIDTAVESANLWSHLFQAGYLTQVPIEGGAFCTDTACLSNGFGGYMQVRWDGNNHQLHTGMGIPVQILAALDTRYDDGLPLSGMVQVSDSNQCHTGGYYQPRAAECDAVFHWL